MFQITNQICICRLNCSLHRLQSTQNTLTGMDCFFTVLTAQKWICLISIYKQSQFTATVAHIFDIYIYRTKCGLKQKNNYFDVAICNPLKNTHTNTDRNAVQLPKILGSQAGWPCDHSWLPQHEIAWPSWDPKSRQKIQHTLIRDWNILANNVQKQWSITSCFFLDLIFCWYWIYWVVGPMWGGEFKIRGARIIFHDYQPFEVGHLDWIYTRRSLLPDSVPPQYISISVVCS